MLSLNINKLRSEVEDREKKKIKVFENILEMCYKKIIDINKQNDNYSCTFVVPNFVFGLPLYNIGDCVKFVMDKLIEKGFEIYFALPTTIHISWRPEGSNRSYINNPINNYITNTPYNNNNQLMIKYNGLNNKNKMQHNQNQQNQYNQTQNNQNNQNKNYKDNNIQYKSINEYKERTDSIYDLDDLDIFQNKVENLF